MVVGAVVVRDWPVVLSVGTGLAVEEPVSGFLGKTVGVEVETTPAMGLETDVATAGPVRLEGVDGAEDNGDGWCCCCCSGASPERVAGEAVAEPEA